MERLLPYRRSASIRCSPSRSELAAGRWLTAATSPALSTLLDDGAAAAAAAAAAIERQ